MRLWTKLAALSLLAYATLSSSAHAALQHADWTKAGDSAITVDSNTGFEWLKLNQTAGMSINEVIAQMGKGGKFYGWRLPTDTEVEALVKAIMPALTFNEDGTTYSGSGYRGYTTTWRTWMQTVRYTSSGPLENGNRYWYSYGMYRGDAGQTELSGTYYRIKNSFGTRTYYSTIYDDNENADYNLDYKNINAGVFLVSDGGMTFDPNDQNAELPGTPGNPSTTPPVNNVPVHGVGFMFFSLMLVPALRRRLKNTSNK